MQKYFILGVGKNSRIAVASKDQSKVFIQNAKVENSQIGFASFRKKSEFGPGTIEVENLEMNNLETPFLVEKDSKLKINGVPITSWRRNVGKLLYDGNL